ncbi:hypothetical protein B0J18DRAFT_154836 [Chaetomium sp. MPI-SDFR-AT-0129]|nr:hypothetical protein B0J18DRAFT_154836 [Chaetomium sp. MPI-SDFR-AT-0129]
MTRNTTKTDDIRNGWVILWFTGCAHADFRSRPHPHPRPLTTYHSPLTTYHSPIPMPTPMPNSNFIRIPIPIPTPIPGHAIKTDESHSTNHKMCLALPSRYSTGSLAGFTFQTVSGGGLGVTQPGRPTRTPDGTCFPHPRPSSIKGGCTGQWGRFLRADMHLEYDPT